MDKNSHFASHDDQALLDLIQQARAGDDAALGQLLEAFRGPLRAQSQQDLRDGIDARVDASDIVQRTYMSAVAHFQDFHGESPGEFLGWLRQILRRNLVDEVRKHTETEKRDMAKEVAGDDAFTAFLLEGSESTPSRAMMRQEEADGLSAAIERLPEAQAMVVRMKHLDGLRLREIAERMGRSEQAVAGLLRRAVRQLRHDLESEN